MPYISPALFHRQTEQLLSLCIFKEQNLSIFLDRSGPALYRSGHHALIYILWVTKPLSFIYYSEAFFLIFSTWQFLVFVVIAAIFVCVILVEFRYSFIFYMLFSIFMFVMGRADLFWLSLLCY